MSKISAVSDQHSVIQAIKTGHQQTRQAGAQRDLPSSLGIAAYQPYLGPPVRLPYTAKAEAQNCKMAGAMVNMSAVFTRKALISVAPGRIGYSLMTKKFKPVMIMLHKWKQMAGQVSPPFMCKTDSWLNMLCCLHHLPITKRASCVIVKKARRSRTTSRTKHEVSFHGHHCEGVDKGSTARHLSVFASTFTCSSNKTHTRITHCLLETLG
jgi:hypothetical protein